MLLEAEAILLVRDLECELADGEIPNRGPIRTLEDLIQDSMFSLMKDWLSL